MARQRRGVTVKVPASTSNLGSGFDTLGLALNLCSRVTVTRVNAEGVQIESSNAIPVDKAAVKMASAAATAFFSAAGVPAFGIAVSVHGNVPIARGVGFSATLRLGIVAALDALAGTQLGCQCLLDLGTSLEGHPDNISPSLLGGFTASGLVDGSVRCLRFPVNSRLKLVALFPNVQLRTDLARSVLPFQYSRADAVHGLNRSALITAAFASQSYEMLRGLFDDRVHQPSRERLLPQLSRVIRAGEKAGAIGGFLSGAGSGILCLALRKAEEVANAMRSALPEAEVRILRADNAGLKIE